MTGSECKRKSRNLFQCTKSYWLCALYACAKQLTKINCKSCRWLNYCVYIIYGEWKIFLYKMCTYGHPGLHVTVRHGSSLSDCQLVSDEGRRQLRSATSRTCDVRRTYSYYGDRCFAAAGPKLWNSLPAELRQAEISCQRFKRLLKTFLFGCWDRGALWLTVKPAPHKFFYLLTLLYLGQQTMRVRLRVKTTTRKKTSITSMRKLQERTASIRR